MVKVPKQPPKKPIAEVINIKEIYEMGNSIDLPYLKCAFLLMYLTGARISELIQLTKRDIILTEDKTLVIKLITLKNKSHPIRSIPIIYYDNPRHAHFNEYEKKMCDEILEYIKELHEEDLLFPFSRYVAYHKFVASFQTEVRFTHGKEILGTLTKLINPHYLRHCRLTHLRQEYGYDAVSLMQFAGWSNTNPAATYLHIGYKDLRDEMIK